MKLLTPGILQVFDLVPPELREYAYIAGGAAYCPEKSRDVDIWLVTGEIPCEGLTVEIAKTRWLGWLKRNGYYEGAPPRDGEKYEGWVSGEPIREQIHFIDHVEFQALDNGVDLLIAEETNAQALIDGFDLDIHAQAIGHDGRRLGVPGTPLKEITIRRFTTPRRTLVRVNRLSARYNLPIEPASHAALLYEIQAPIDAYLVAQRLGARDEVPF